MFSDDDYEHQLEQFDADCDTALYHTQIEPQSRPNENQEAA